MSAVCSVADAKPPDGFVRRVEELVADNAILTDRVARLEIFTGKLCVALGVEPLPPTIGPESKWTTIKGVCADTNYSPSRIRQLIAIGEIMAVRLAGRVLVDSTSVKLFLARRKQCAHKGQS